MSFLTTTRLALSMRTSVVARNAFSRPVAAAATSSFHTSAVRRALGESDHSDGML